MDIFQLYGWGIDFESTRIHQTSCWCYYCSSSKTFSHVDWETNSYFQSWPSVLLSTTDTIWIQTSSWGTFCSFTCTLSFLFTSSHFHWVDKFSLEKCWMSLMWMSICDLRIQCGLRNYWKRISIILDNKEDSIRFFKRWKVKATLILVLSISFLFS